MALKAAQVQQYRETLLAWYDVTGRTLPWRIRPRDRQQGRIADPYRIWLSEIMCQQTRIQTVIPYYAKFLQTWPTIADLANADLDEVYRLWAGLGYYARARNLHACARKIMATGGFPRTEKDWLALPGIGPYTAAALMAILQDAPTNVVDGNVLRVMARLFGVSTALPAAKSELGRLAAQLVQPARAGDYAQALMDLGALICTPKSPKCEVCPWSQNCAAFGSDQVDMFPVRSQTRKKPKRYGVGFVVICNGQVLLQQRPATGLLGGMSEVPGTPWRLEEWENSEAIDHAPIAGEWEDIGKIHHVFSHFSLDLRGLQVTLNTDFAQNSGWWAPMDQLEAQALPSVMVKLLALYKF